MNEGEFWDKYYSSMRDIQRPDLMPREFIKQLNEGYIINGNTTWGTNKWLGTHISKNGIDLLMMQEIMTSVRPNIIIETGTELGGSALFFESMMQLLQINGKIYSIDILNHPDRKALLPKRPSIEWIHGESGNPATLEYLKGKLQPTDTVLVDLDSDHSKEHVLKELDLYSQLVSKGSYLIVEDANISPSRYAIMEWLPNHPEFEIDTYQHRHFLTFNPNGYLKRVN